MQINKVYVAGPMTGLLDENRPSFRYAEQRLRDAGFEPVLPPGIDDATHPQWATMTRGEKYKHVMPKDIAALATCDGIFLLPGFENSDGTAFEMHGTDLFEMEQFRPAFESGMIGLEQWVDETIQLIRNHNDRLAAVKV